MQEIISILVGIWAVFYLVKQTYLIFNKKSSHCSNCGFAKPLKFKK